MGVDRAIDITAAQRKIILALLRKHLPNTTAWVYGSRATWNARPQSDLDMVVFTTPMQERGVAALRDAFEESALPFRVDLFVWDAVPKSFHKRIEAERVVLVAAGDDTFEDVPVDVAGEWIKATIEDIVASSRNALVGGPFGSSLVSRDYVSEGVPVIRGQNMGSRWIAGDFVFVTPQKAKSLEANLARPDDIILTQRGTLGQVSLVPSTSFRRYLVSQSQMKVTANREIADPLFFYYVLSSAQQQDYVRQNAIQTGVPHTNLSILRATPVPVPPLKEQRAIAHILGTLDDKIELNRRMNATLEEMARALFKSWFVDFDPVHAKATLKRHAASQAPRQFDGSTGKDRVFPSSEGWPKAGVGRPRRALVAEPTPPLSRHPSEEGIGEAAHRADRGDCQVLRPQGGRDWTVERARAYLDGLDADIAALFPDSFVDSELGAVPAGWEVKPLPDAIDINPTRPLRKGEVAPYLDMANMPTKGHTPDTVIGRPFGSGMRFTNGDTLLARITPCLENGKTAYVDFLEKDTVGWGSTEYIVMRPKPPLPNEFAYCLARSAGFREFVIQSMTGSSGRQRVPVSVLSNYPLLLPSGGKVPEVFGEIVKPFFSLASQNAEKSRTLTALRDTLLPKLISGEVRVPEAEKLTGGVV